MLRGNYKSRRHRRLARVQRPLEWQRRHLTCDARACCQVVVKIDRTRHRTLADIGGVDQARQYRSSLEADGAPGDSAARAPLFSVIVVSTSVLAVFLLGGARSAPSSGSEAPQPESAQVGLVVGDRTAQFAGAVAVQHSQHLLTPPLVCCLPGHSRRPRDELPSGADPAEPDHGR